MAGDLGIRGDRIAAIGDLAGARAAREIDATGQVVAPGFIDPHIHSEIALLAQDEEADAGLRQGVTTNFTGPDGFGFAQLSPALARAADASLQCMHGRHPNLRWDWPTPEAYLADFEGRTPVNVVAQAPHAAIRLAAMGWEPRRANPAELEQMRRLTRAWMEAGAVGLCVGLDYQPSVHSDTDEQVELAKVAAEYGGRYSAHGRSLEFGRAGAFRETIEVGRRAELPVCVSHERVDEECAGLLDEAVAAGVDLTTESHLYSAGSTHLLYYVPLEDQVGGPMAVLERLADAGYAGRLARRLDEAFAGPAAPGLNAYFAATRTGRRIGQTVRQAVDEMGVSPGEGVVRLMREELPDAMMVYPWGQTEAEFEPTAIASLRHPAVVVSSDGVYHGPMAHPRGFGAFPRVLRRFVRELGVISLPEAIWKMSGLPAQRYGLRDRGRIDRDGGRPRRLRPGDRGRPRDLRRATTVPCRHRDGHRQRPGRGRSRRADGGSCRPSPAAMHITREWACARGRDARCVGPERDKVMRDARCATRDE